MDALEQKFISAWTESYLHFGNRSSSMAEGDNAKLKFINGWLSISYRKKNLAIKHKFNKVRVKLSYEKIHILHMCDTTVFRELLYHVSHYSLKEMHTYIDSLHWSFYGNYGSFFCSQDKELAMNEIFIGSHSSTLEG
ncbi:hypothetical protein LXL04_027953 [Taraxacum kok-saghyz]